MKDDCRCYFDNNYNIDKMNDNTKEKQTITKVVTVRLFGIKILTITTKIPSSELDLLSARNGTDEASL